ncbi:enoyl-CoA delta isomerase 2, peroxisomal-like [Morus notabilis]|uniref:enoyl-CoA delta isomerase 2, peroxisomal-like n=1 Tax=Morus notabilis TaxID=981085 RepID=UPI000CED095F|nr:enoyl-CoA delta isomerase 2, peroxisomal-like [Morus notabilis]
MCTVEKRGNLFFLNLTGDDDHRLSPAVISSLLSSLSQIKSQATRGSALITTADGSKFFSNGFDLAWAQSAGSPSAAIDRLKDMVAALKPVIAALISLPMPTIACLPGHAAAGGFLLALSHDYIVMRKDRGVLYMSEVDLGLRLPDYFAAVLRAKIGSAAVRREVALIGRKIGGEEAVRMGIAESAHDSKESAAEAAVRLGEQLAKRKWNGEVFAEIRKSMFPELLGVLGIAAKEIPPNL